MASTGGGGRMENTCHQGFFSRLESKEAMKKNNVWGVEWRTLVTKAFSVGWIVKKR